MQSVRPLILGFSEFFCIGQVAQAWPALPGLAFRFRRGRVLHNFAAINFGKSLGIALQLFAQFLLSIAQSSPFIFGEV